MCAALAASLIVPNFAIVPKPVSLTPRPGFFTVDSRTSIEAAPGTQHAVTSLRNRLKKSMNITFGDKTSPVGKIRVSLDSTLGKLGNEGYRLVVSPDAIDVRANTSAGAFYGIQTLLQLCPPEIFGDGKQRLVTFNIPCVEIEDSPRFRWRGGHLDVSRHFMSVDVVKKYIDLLALHKMNRFHWHLTDDQGWRIQINKYPLLTKIGSKRSDTMLIYNPPKFSGEPHAGFYTQRQIRDVVKYAADRFITVVPEIEMPGHAQAAIAAYPELGNTGEKLEVATKWGVIPNVFNVEDSTIQFLKNVLDEVLKLFPSEFIHIGGDECPKDQWKASEKAQAKIKALGLKDEHELQSWFIAQMDAYLAQKGRRLIGWSEILEGGLAPGAALMVWLGDEGAMKAVSSGHDVVMAQTSHTYFDYYQSKDRTSEPHAIGGFLPIEKVYAYDPILLAMSAEQAKHVLGVQFQIWTEYIPDGPRVEYMAYPRACALAEVAWSPIDGRSFEEFKTRLETHLRRLTILGVNYRKLID